MSLLTLSMHFFTRGTSVCCQSMDDIFGQLVCFCWELNIFLTSWKLTFRYSYLFFQWSFFQYLLDGMFFPRFSSGGGIKSSIFCIKSANSSRKLYNEDLLLWNCNELLRISDPRWESEWSQSITTSRQSLNIIFGLVWGRDKTIQHCRDSVHWGCPNVRIGEKYKLEKIFNGHTYSLATLAIKTALKSKSQTVERIFSLRPRTRPGPEIGSAFKWCLASGQIQGSRLTHGRWQTSEPLGPVNGLIILSSVTHVGDTFIGCGDCSRLSQQ